jgi:PII-like signaling protein
MNDILVARVYISESEHYLDKVLTVLHDEIKVDYVTVLRGIEGFEEGGKVQASKFLSLSLSLPLVVEFFDEPTVVEGAIELIKKVVKDSHILTFSAQRC